MNLKELLWALRSTVLSDTAKPYLWSDEELIRFFNNAVREASLRARLLRVDWTGEPSICSYDVVPASSPPRMLGQAGRIKLHKSIIMIRSGALLRSPYPLQLASSDDMDRCEPGWSTSRIETNQPRYLVLDLEQRIVQLWPMPIERDTFVVRAWRSPLDTELMKKPDDEPVINLPDPEELKHWAAHEAYMKKDGETFDEDRSNAHLALFEQRFGARPSLHEMRRWADTPPRTRLARMF